jgi:hypothetical protein
MPDVPAPILLVDGDPTLSSAIDRRLAGKRHLMLLPQVSQIRDYLRASTRAGRRPALMIVRVRSEAADDEGATLVDWVREQSVENLARLPIVMLAEFDTLKTDSRGQTSVVTTLDALLDVVMTVETSSARDTRDPRDL